VLSSRGAWQFDAALFCPSDVRVVIAVQLFNKLSLALVRSFYQNFAITFSVVTYRMVTWNDSSSSTQLCRVVIADANEVLREGIATVLRRDPKLCVCGLASSQQTTSELIEREEPDVLVLNLFLGYRDGVFFIKDLSHRFTGLRIIAFAAGTTEVYGPRALRAGATAYVSITASAAEIARAVSSESTNGSDSGSRRLQRRIGQQASIDDLTDRELHVFQLVGRGLRTGRIAEELKLSRKTVEYYLEQIKQKLGYSGAEELLQGALDCVRGRSAELFLPPRQLNNHHKKPGSYPVSLATRNP